MPMVPVTEKVCARGHATAFRHVEFIVYYRYMSIKFMPSKRGWILQLHDLNYSYQNIGRIIGSSKSGARKTVQILLSCIDQPPFPSIWLIPPYVDSHWD